MGTYIYLFGRCRLRSITVFIILVPLQSSEESRPGAHSYRWRPEDTINRRLGPEIDLLGFLQLLKTVIGGHCMQNESTMGLSYSAHSTETILHLSTSEKVISSWGESKSCQSINGSEP